MTKRIFISACEPSADAHCAKLIKAVSQADGGIEFVGVGGEKMAEAGCEILEDTVNRAVMIYKAFSHVGYYYNLIKRVANYLQNNQIDLVIVCDSPAFNFHVAKAAKKCFYNTLFYVAPQLWAWAPWRIRKLHRRCDKLACILPFEESWFSLQGIDTTFVGNPLFDGLDVNFDESCKDYEDYSARSARIALMPGSRKAEVKSLWPAMQNIAIALKKRYTHAMFAVVAANEEIMEIIKSKRPKGFECEYTLGTVFDTARQADLSLVASGSVTLQVAGAGCPMVIMYQSSRLLWHLVGRWLVRTRFLALVNILAGRELVTEFMPYFSSTKPVLAECNRLLSSKASLIKMSRELVDLVKPIAQHNASQNTAQIVIDMLRNSD